MIVLSFFTNLFLSADPDQFFLILQNLLYMAGLWFIFRKCGVEGWWALIPCAREAKLGLVADRANEGRISAVVAAVLILENLIHLVVPEGSEAGERIDGFLFAVELIAALIHTVYIIRVYLGLCETFGCKKRWIMLWILAECLPAALWGFLKRYQPLWTVRDLKENKAANFFSDAKAMVLENGLTVNLEERTAVEAFKKKYLLRDIHMVIQPGHMVLLLGGSGAGKTTFLNAVNGYEKAKAEVMLNGHNMYSEYRDMKYDIGFVPQQDLMRGSDSVLRTLTDAAAMRLPANFTKDERKARVDEVMAIFGLTPVQQSLVNKLSGGQRKRLSIAMEFLSNPMLFILDEPDSGLDGVIARELFQQLRLIADQGKIIIVITHTPDRVIDLFDDVIVLAKDANRTGRLAYFGPIGDARTFFGKETMEEIVKSVNRTEEGGEGRADEFILKYAEVQTCSL